MWFDFAESEHRRRSSPWERITQQWARSTRRQWRNARRSSEDSSPRKNVLLSCSDWRKRFSLSISLIFNEFLNFELLVFTFSLLKSYIFRVDKTEWSEENWKIYMCNSFTIYLKGCVLYTIPKKKKKTIETVTWILDFYVGNHDFELKKVLP